jgi:hypothetical protein
VEPLPPPETPNDKAPLKRAVQLLKRWRDVHYARAPRFAPISIVLTTLAGQHYGAQQSVSGALAGILGGITGSLPRNGGRLYVLNPAHPSEDLSERWDEDPGAYRAFVSGITTLQAAWEAVLAERGLHQVTAALAALFGEQVTQAAVTDQAKAVERLRAERQLGVRRSSGTLAGLGAGSVAVRPNTFYGS